VWARELIVLSIPAHEDERVTNHPDFTIEVLEFSEVHTLPGTWDSQSYRSILEELDYDEIADIAESDLPEMAAMAAQDAGQRKAADRVLSFVFGDAMSAGVRQNLIDDLTDERPWEQFADLELQAGIFEAVEFLQRAFPTDFGIPDAARVRVRLTAKGKHPIEWLRDGPEPSLLLRLLADAMDEEATLRRLYADQLESKSFPEAAAILWRVSKTEDDLDREPACCVLEVHSSLQWLGPLREADGEHHSFAEPDD
jgi:hypothetical protein